MSAGGTTDVINVKFCGKSWAANVCQEDQLEIICQPRVCCVDGFRVACPSLEGRTKYIQIGFRCLWVQIYE